MDYRITHRTIYDYTAGVTVSHHAARLMPMAGQSQRISKFSIAISPTPAVRKESRDYFELFQLAPSCRVGIDVHVEDAQT